MLGELFGSTNKERALIYLIARDKGYAREIARFYGTPGGAPVAANVVSFSAAT